MHLPDYFRHDRDSFRYLVLVGAFIILVVLHILYSSSKHSARRKNVPVIKASWYIPQLISSILFARRHLIEGFHKYPGQFFKMRMYPFGNIYVGNGRALIEEIRQAPEDILSFWPSVERMVQISHNMHPSTIADQYHMEMVRSTLTRNLGSLLPDVLDELQHAFGEVFPLTGDEEWTSVPAHTSALSLICRATGRILVGQPICREPEYWRLTSQFTIDAGITAFIVSLFPEWLHGVLGRLLTKNASYTRGMTRVIEKEVKRRLRCLELYGKEWADKPNDFLTWMIESAPPLPEEELIVHLARRVLHLNFAALHTTSLSFTHVLYHLAAQPEYLQPLREEVSHVISEEGWTKNALNRMIKIDSFLRESARMNSLGITSLGRRAVRDHTFSDGTFVPKGSWVAANAYSAHMDEGIYPSPLEFKPFRFSELRESASESPTSGAKHQLVTLNPNFLAFGYGHHACTGRFFAATEMKTMLAYLVMNYDIDLSTPGLRPENMYIGINCLANRTAHILVRKRRS